MKIGYIRVSSAGQQDNSSLPAQTAALEAEGVAPEHIYTDVASGKNAERLQLQAMEKALHNGDQVIVAKLDRLGRNPDDLRRIVAAWAKKGVSFKALNVPGLDTATPSGTLILTMMGALAEYERTLILERTAMGREAARKAGKITHRKPNWTEKDVKKAVKMRAAGISVPEIARALRLSVRTVGRLFAAARAAGMDTVPQPHKK